MPWKEKDKVSQRVEFIGRLLQGERMTDLCEAFGISRKTGYKLKLQFYEYGPEAFEDFSRRPKNSPNQTLGEIVDLIVSWRMKHPTWGPKKLKCEMEKAHPGVKIPAASTIGEILSRKNLVRRRKRRRHASPTPTGLRETTAPNDLWCTDFKGEFRLGNRKYCYPLTIGDHFSRFAIACEALEGTAGTGVRLAFQMAFEKYGLPRAIRSDNGVPFASGGLCGLTRLSVWWMRLGIKLERIEPGHPEQNGRLERFHLTLKEETTRPPSQNSLQQQERFDDFRTEFNKARPHEALSMKYPAEVYKPSERKYDPDQELEPLKYPLHDLTLRVRNSGYVGVRQYGDVYLSKALIGENVGLRELVGGWWLVTFMDMDLGYINSGTGRLEQHPPDLMKERG